MRVFPGLLSVAVALAAGLFILAVAISPFLTPTWVAFEQDRANAAAWTGYNPEELRMATDAILSDLVLGPPNFDVMVGRMTVLTDAERDHMRDVRRVFMAFYIAAAGALVVLLVTRVVARGDGSWSSARFLGSVRAGAVGLAIVIVAAGAVAAVAFDAAFEVFHRLFFAAGTYNFDPRTYRLVQLFPDAFWSDTTMAVGGLALVLSLIVALIATRRLRADRASRTPGSGDAAR
ncbi:MAG: DUF1461 domain-containing protein [Chloroflexota bacterium]